MPGFAGGTCLLETALFSKTKKGGHKPLHEPRPVSGNNDQGLGITGTRGSGPRFAAARALRCVRQSAAWRSFRRRSVTLSAPATSGRYSEDYHAPRCTDARTNRHPRKRTRDRAREGHGRPCTLCRARRDNARRKAGGSVNQRTDRKARCKARDTDFQWHHATCAALVLVHSNHQRLSAIVRASKAVPGSFRTITAIQAKMSSNTRTAVVGRDLPHAMGTQTA